MCGIAGLVDYTAHLTETAHPETVRAMTRTMACRGPDDSGVWVGEHAALGHRRLAIIDLAGGRQPMRDGDVVLTYSGEVYNYAELRAELVAAGHRFRTSSDTEVVLRAYLQWGDALVDRLNGMYAFAVWDGRERRLLLVRDRLGIKPLYYYPTASGVLFGSEPKAILANPVARRAVGLAGLRDLVGWTMALGWSLWQGMHEVEPGQLVVVDESGLRARTYWRLEAAEHPDDLATTVSRVRELLTDTVERQLVADVPRCVLLSGGLDSSSITGLAAARLRAEGERLRTFSVDFTGREESFRVDEVRATPDTPYIRDVVGLVGSDHETISLDPAALSDPALRRTVITARDLPLGFGEMDTSLYLLFQAIRARSTVALSGEAADEVFGGYPWFHDEAAVGSGTFPWLAFQSAMSGDRAAVIHPDVRAALDLPAYVADEYATAVARVPHLVSHDPAERRRRVATHLHLTRFVRMLLDRKDRVSMAVGLEVRVPFCDHRLVEYAFNTPWSMKTFDGREKSLLRHAAAHVLPASARDRKKASYPSIQDPAYLTALQQQAKEVLADVTHPVHDLIDRAWLTDAVALDPVAVPSHIRRGVDRVLDLYHWLDLYQPDILA
jgi:asparagine synthase (glutamine-hydrolysing)